MDGVVVVPNPDAGLEWLEQRTVFAAVDNPGQL
jgi:hypothetical protein